VRLNTETRAVQPTITNTSTELAIISAIPAIVPAEFFKPNGADAVLSALKEEVRKVAATLDISTPGGREAIASLAYKVARSKTALDEQGKELVVAIKKHSGEIDAERKRVRDELDALKDEVRKPLTDWENTEKERVAAHESALTAIGESSEYGTNETVENLRKRLAYLNNYPARDWQEFAARAAQTLRNEILRTEGLLARAEKREAEIAEAKRLDEEARERAIKEREEAAARAAKEAAERRAEEQVRIARETAERERQRIENERAEAEARAKQAEAERIAAEQKAERDLKEAAHRAVLAAQEAADSERRAIAQERQRLADQQAEAARAAAAAETRRIRDAEQAEARRIAEAEAAELAQQKALKAAENERIAAVAKERLRLEDEQREARIAAETRAKNKAHRLKIDNEVLGAIVALDIPMDRAQDLLIAIAKGAVPHVTIEY
jgi:polyhydroxyalkanoate synthesis regulator phasin